MGESGFHILLPSNSSASVFPQNTISCFTISLARALELPGEWEVGLAEIQYPHTWNNLNANTPFEIANETKKWSFILQRGYYSEIPVLLEVMNNLISRGPDHPEALLHYDRVTGKVRLKTNGPYTIQAGGRLANMLGLVPNRHTKTPPFKADITAGFSTLYVYTDIVEHQIVGDFYVPLLRCVPVRGQSDECVNIVYDKPHYIPVSKHHIDTITIEIKSDQNKKVPFRSGKVLVKLHFRPRRILKL